MKSPGRRAKKLFRLHLGCQSAVVHVEGADVVIAEQGSGLDDVSGERAQSYEDVPPGTALEGLLLPVEMSKRTGEPYKLLKVLTQPATPEQFERPEMSCASDCKGLLSPAKAREN